MSLILGPCGATVSAVVRMGRADWIATIDPTFTVVNIAALLGEPGREILRFERRLGPYF